MPIPKINTKIPSPPKTVRGVTNRTGGSAFKMPTRYNKYVPKAPGASMGNVQRYGQPGKAPAKRAPIPPNLGSRNVDQGRYGAEGGLSAGITYGNTWGTTPLTTPSWNNTPPYVPLGFDNTPTATPPPGWDGGGDWGGGWDGGGGGGGPAPITWSEFDSGIANKPAWWKALKPSDLNEGTEFLASLNLLIPFLSPEDQRSVASTLYAQDAKNFGHLSPEKIGTENPAITPDLQKFFTSSDRASKALAALEKLSTAVGKGEADMGKGYRYLRSILSAVKSYGAREGEQRVTRSNMTNLYSTLDPLLNQGKGEELGAYGPLANMLSKPFFTKGQLMPLAKTQDGRYIFGEPNKALF